MIPDPSTAQTPIAGSGGSARDDAYEPSRAGHLCICGEPLEESQRDMWVFASETTVAYITCLFAEVG